MPTKLLTTLLLTTILAGCVTPEAIKANREKYKGKTVEQFVEALGHPHEEQRVMGKDVYIWKREFNSTNLENRQEHHSCIARMVTKNGIIEEGNIVGDSVACSWYKGSLSKLK